MRIYESPELIVCGCKVGYGITKIRRIWIIHKFYMDYPMFRIEYLIISLTRLKPRGILDVTKVCWLRTLGL